MIKDDRFEINNFPQLNTDSILQILRHIRPKKSSEFLIGLGILLELKRMNDYTEATLPEVNK